MTEAVITLHNVGLDYRLRSGLFRSNVFSALKNVSFEVTRGEIFGVLGRNGSGKSTLLQLLAGVLKPDHGHIITQEKLTRSLLTLGLGFNTQLTGRDNALISCMMNGYSKKDTMTFLENIKEFSELGDFFEQPVKSYSAGMKARLGFSTGITINVDLLLIDEVLGTGDESFNEKSNKAMLEKIHGDQTVVFVSHSAGKIKSLCDRCVWLEKGEMKMLGATQDVIEPYIAASKVNSRI